MDILAVGPWVLLGVGTLSLLGALFISLTRKEGKSPWIIWVFGFGISGVGIYGPVFLSSYGSFLKTIADLKSDPTAQAYSSAFDKIGNGDLSAEHADVVLQYAIAQPVEATDSLLQVAITKAKDPAGKRALENAKTLYLEKQASVRFVARALEQSPNPSLQLDSLDAVTRTMVARKLLEIPPSNLQRMNIDRNRIAMYSKEKRRIG